MRNATLKASVMLEAPNTEAMSNSRTKPVTRDARVNKDTTEADLNKLTQRSVAPCPRPHC
ncbi:MAG: hypothetical protein Fur007_16880 [Rhodoferax sp.]